MRDYNEIFTNYSQGSLHFQLFSIKNGQNADFKQTSARYWVSPQLTKSNKLSRQNYNDHSTHFIDFIVEKLI